MASISVYRGIASKPLPGAPFDVVTVAFSPDMGMHYSLQTYLIGRN
jgi:hypothetical protein